MVTIRNATPADLDEVLRVEREAFGGTDVADLVEALLMDPSAEPIVSLLAEKNGRAIGHIMFTAAVVEGSPETAVTLLAPLAVVPGEQRVGVGRALAEAGLKAAKECGAQMAFVLGHIEYYPRFGFEPALARGLVAPYPIPDEVADAWMVLELEPGALTGVRGRVRAADAMMHPEHWRE